ncbi:MAG: hypothetical protein JNK61_12120 [Bacteroidia bacterium]|nr:hypothetical protein [Bacteroidia bacterium]
MAVIAVFKYQTKQPVNKAFYYWQQTYNPSLSENSLMDTLAVNKLYIKYFDVVWDANLLRAQPVATVHFNKPCNKDYVPVVYITNEVFKNLSKKSVDSLYINITKLILAINVNYNPTEIQFDCDWTDKTTEKYFKFLHLFKSDKRFSNVNLSATIRLHQIKYKSRTGVPPVDRGMLMFYNMGKLKQIETTNSIFNNYDAGKYVSYLDNYPLPLDYALPVFGWSIYFRNGKSQGILNDTYATTLDTMAYIKKLSTNRYMVVKDQFYRGIYLKTNDLIRAEFVDDALAQKAAKMLVQYSSNKPQTVALFHLNENLITTYEISDFKKLFDTYR